MGGVPQSGISEEDWIFREYWRTLLSATVELRNGAGSDFL